ncbi:MAG: hypothetical protein G01um101420_245 [Parcubacteria group bacterium Gr01-1014_20]|nr:MAG: hypothetical protein G01um101420_245 [Parcubacteria group bacterium Gr01-1014_20]
MSKMLRLGVVIALATITAFLTGNAENLRTSIMSEEKEPLFRIPNDAQTGTDSTRFLELSAVIYTLDSNYWDYIRGTSAMERFVSRIADHQQKHAAEWLLALRGIEWAKDSTHCLGNPWQFEVDARWAYFIRFGPPSAYWSPMYEVTVPGGRIDTTQTFFNWWDTRDTGLAAQVFKAEWYPPESSSVFPRVEAIVGDTIKSKFGKALYPELDIVSFPNEDSTFDVGISSSITGNKLTKETLLDRRKLEVELQVFNADSLVFASHQTQKLGLAGLILSVTKNDEDLAFTYHFSVPNLPEGKYRAKLTVEGDRNNAGKITEKFILPSILTTKGMSDILLVDAFPVVGEDISSGIKRLDQNLYWRGSNAFNTGDTLSPYIEIMIPKVRIKGPPRDSSYWWSYLEDSSSVEYFPGPAQDPNAWSYTISVFLKPIRKNREPIYSAENREGFVSGDSLGKPVLKWGGIDLREKHKQLQREMGRMGASLQTNDLELLFARASQLPGQFGSFESSFEVKRVAPGDYWMIIAVEATDLYENEWSGNSMKRVRINEIKFPTFGSRF